MSLCECGCGELAPLAQKTHRARGWVKGQPLRFVWGHNPRTRGPLWEEQDRGYSTPCWVWKLATTTRGYGQKHMPDGRMVLAHRWVYEQHAGRIPEGLQLDHLCRIRECVNPAHLEPVTCRENIQRGHRARAMEEVR